MFTTIVHHYPDRTLRFPALEGMDKLPVMRTFWVSSVVCAWLARSSAFWGSHYAQILSGRSFTGTLSW
jgi:hypothetical protein